MLALFGLIQAGRAGQSQQGPTAFVAAAARRLADARGPDTARLEREIKTHVQAIEMYEGEARDTKSQLHGFALCILPQLKKNLAALRSLKNR